MQAEGTVIVTDRQEEQGVCPTCGAQTGGGSCTRCWQMEHGLEDYARSEKGRAHLQTVLGSTGLVPVESNEAERLIAMVLTRDGQLNIEALNAMLALRDKLRAEKAEAEFLAAFSKFQGIRPPIPKTKQAEKHKYADMSDIERILGPSAAECGLSWHWEEEFRPDNQVMMYFVLSHVGCHKERTPWGPYDPYVLASINTGNFKINALQARASATTYAHRYSACSGFGVTPEGEDTDARLGTGNGQSDFITSKQEAAIEALIGQSIAPEVTRRKFLAFMKLEHVSDVTQAMYGKATKSLQDALVKQAAKAAEKGQQQTQAKSEPTPDQPAGEQVIDVTPEPPETKEPEKPQEPVWACGRGLQAAINGTIKDLYALGVPESQVVDIAVAVAEHARYSEFTAEQAKAFQTSLMRAIQFHGKSHPKGRK